MNPFPYSFVDPYADDSHIKPPRKREWDPLGPLEPWKKYFAHPPVTEQVPPTGSYYYRWGLINDASMTPKEQRFEQFVNEMQKRHDERSQLDEWRRRRDYEENIIDFYHQIGRNVPQFTTQMITTDQQEMEFRCQRKKEKAENIQAQMTLDYAFWYKQRHNESGAQEAAERAMDAERRSIKTMQDQKAAFQASSHPLANKRTVTNAAGSQQALQESKLTSLKSEEHGNTSQPISSARLGSLRQQEQKQKLSPEEIRRQFLDQVQNKARSLSAKNGRSISSAEAGSSKLQEQKTKLSVEENRRQFKDQAQNKAGSSSATNGQSITSAEAGSSKLQEQKTKLSAKEVRRQLQEQFQDRVRLSPATERQSMPSAEIGSSRQQEQKTELSMKKKSAVSAPETLKTEFNPAVSAVTEDLTELHQGPSSEAEQRLLRRISQQSDSSREYTVTAPSEQRSTSPSSGRSLSNGSTPQSSAHSSSPEATPAETSPNTHRRWGHVDPSPFARMSPAESRHPIDPVLRERLENRGAMNEADRRAENEAAGNDLPEPLSQCLSQFSRWKVFQSNGGTLTEFFQQNHEPQLASLRRQWLGM